MVLVCMSEETVEASNQEKKTERKVPPVGLQLVVSLSKYTTYIEAWCSKYAKYCFKGPEI